MLLCSTISYTWPSHLALEATTLDSVHHIKSHIMVIYSFEKLVRLVIFLTARLVYLLGLQHATTKLNCP